MQELKQILTETLHHDKQTRNNAEQMIKTCKTNHTQYIAALLSLNELDDATKQAASIQIKTLIKRRFSEWELPLQIEVTKAICSEIWCNKITKEAVDAMVKVKEVQQVETTECTHLNSRTNEKVRQCSRFYYQDSVNNSNYLIP